MLDAAFSMLCECQHRPRHSAQLREKIDDPIEMHLLGQHHHRPIEESGLYSTVHWKLRAAVNETLPGLRVEQRPDKTLIGRVERGLVFWAIDSARAAVAAKADAVQGQTPA